jgi:hypothetical protein
MSSRPIDPTELSPAQIRKAIELATWVSELTALHRERKIFFSEEKIVLTGILSRIP